MSCRLGIALLSLALWSCGKDSSSDSDGDPPAADALSTAFTKVGCASSSCHGSDGKRESTAITHGDEDKVLTNLSTSERDLVSWTAWIRTDAHAPMPTYTAAEYSDSDLKADYTFLTGRTE